MIWPWRRTKLEAPAEDIDLSARCRAGEEEAKAELFHKYAPGLHRLIRRFVHSPSDAEDLLQQSFLEVLLSIGRYRGESPLQSWLRTITLRVVFRHLKKRPPPQALPEEPPDTQDLTQQLEHRAALRRLQVLLGKLSEKRRAVFILHEVEGFSLPEAAQILEISTTAAKKRVWEARRDLADLTQGDTLLEHFFAREKDRRER